MKKMKKWKGEKNAKMQKMQKMPFGAGLSSALVDLYSRSRPVSLVLALTRPKTFFPFFCHSFSLSPLFSSSIASQILHFQFE